MFFGIDDPDEVTEEVLPDDFFNMPDTFIEDAGIRQLYYKTYRKLLDENKDADTIEMMMIERAAALYAYMRSLEAATGGYRNSSDYRQLAALWNSMANDLRKTRTFNFDEAKIREEIAGEYISLVNNALRGFDLETANTVRRRVALALKAE